MISVKKMGKTWYVIERDPYNGEYREHGFRIVSEHETRELARIAVRGCPTGKCLA